MSASSVAFLIGIVIMLPWLAGFYWIGRKTGHTYGLRDGYCKGFNHGHVIGKIETLKQAAVAIEDVAQTLTVYKSEVDKIIKH